MEGREQVCQSVAGERQEGIGVRVPSGPRDWSYIVAFGSWTPGGEGDNGQNDAGEDASRLFLTHDSPRTPCHKSRDQDISP